MSIISFFPQATDYRALGARPKRPVAGTGGDRVAALQDGAHSRDAPLQAAAGQGKLEINPNQSNGGLVD